MASFTSASVPDPAVPPQFGAGVAAAGDLNGAEGGIANGAVAESSSSSVADIGSHAGEDPTAESWRDEVAARLHRYRTRRKPKAPRYPSLLLPFDASERWLRSGESVARLLSSPAESAGGELAGGDALMAVDGAAASGRPKIGERDSNFEPAAEQSAKVIEFPRSAAIPFFHPTALADPIFDRPRIVEAPEILPPPPALGGMLIEAPPKEIENRSDSPVASASVLRRALAVLVDGAVLGLAMTAVTAIFLYLNPGMNAVRGPLPILAVIAGVLTVSLWMPYEFLLVVYSGSTPGLRAARLRLAGFDGSPLRRSSRRKRVLASFLSVFAAGIGYLWSALDADGLCWHDRITRSNAQPVAARQKT